MFVVVVVVVVLHLTIKSEKNYLPTFNLFINFVCLDGIVMSNYYAQEICTPSRASLLTGRYPITIGMQYEELQPNEVWGLNLTEKIIPQILKESGGLYVYINCIYCCK